jgi:hypothetical protein
MLTLAIYVSCCLRMFRGADAVVLWRETNLVAAVHADTWEALTARGAGTRDVDDLRLLTGIIRVESSGQARQIPRRASPPGEPVSPRSATVLRVLFG